MGKWWEFSVPFNMVNIAQKIQADKNTRSYCTVKMPSIDNNYIILTGLEGYTTYIAQTSLILPRVEDEGNMGLVRAIYGVYPESKVSLYFYYHPNQTSRAKMEMFSFTHPPSLPQGMFYLLKWGTAYIRNSAELNHCDVIVRARIHCLCLYFVC